MNFLAKDFSANACPEPSKKKHKVIQKMIPAIAENFTRSKGGAKLIQQELGKLLEKQKALFPSKSMCNTDNTVIRFTEHGETKSIKWEALMMRAPYFFSAFFSSVRNRLMYGTSVQKWFAEVPCFHKLFLLSGEEG